MSLKPPSGTNTPDQPLTTGGNARVLIWDTDLGLYTPLNWMADVTIPREFIGPVDPSTLPQVTSLVIGDRWTPTEEPVDS